MVQELDRYFAAEGEAERHPGLGKAIGVPGEDDGDRRRRRRMLVEWMREKEERKEKNIYVGTGGGPNVTPLMLK
ncbi:hypothetical protein C4D60_Mb02t08490 [Musa balbisiana]|uniref:Uncharacterized protein n=1 Tax=Musa balbisiana TaxID=52838 RepID=A0A4S8I966_MUSBA|nr:hypothetical protein C4D60_Mb02t08490 [Musa balbisiana]